MVLIYLSNYLFMNNILLTWGTWTGKTYQFFNRYGDKRFIALFPCRQLCYESFIKYWNKDYSILNGEVHHEPKNNKWIFAVYESVQWINIEDYDVIFIDEFHFLSDEDRWANLYSIIELAKEKWIQVIWATATNNLESKELHELWFVTEKLKPYKKTPKKKEISSSEFYKNASDWMSSIVFVRYTPSEYDIEEWSERTWLPEDKIRIISAAVRPAERLKTQLDFESWKISLILSTNVLAQWLNFPAKQVMIYYNPYDSWEVIQQKLGRLGRPWYCDGDDTVYYTSVEDVKIYKKKIMKMKNGYETSYVPALWFSIDKKFEEYMMPKSLYSYSWYKYSYQVLNYIISKKDKYLTDSRNLELVLAAMEELRSEENKIKNILWIN